MRADLLVSLDQVIVVQSGKRNKKLPLLDSPVDTGHSPLLN